MIHEKNITCSPFSQEQADKSKEKMKELIQMQKIKLKNSFKMKPLMEILS